MRGKLRDARGRVLAAQEGSPEFIRALADETFNEGLLLGLQSRQELLGTKTIRELLQ